MAVFTWKAEVGTSGSGDFAVFASRFGDGYSQQIPNGLNNETQKWSVRVSGYERDVQPVVDFIRAHKGLPFQWKPPMGPLSWFTCTRHSFDPGGGAWMTYVMEFEQGYAP